MEEIIQKYLKENFKCYTYTCKYSKHTFYNFRDKVNGEKFSEYYLKGLIEKIFSVPISNKICNEFIKTEKSSAIEIKELELSNE